MAMTADGAASAEGPVQADATVPAGGTVPGIESVSRLARWLTANGVPGGGRARRFRPARGVSAPAAQPLAAAVGSVRLPRRARLRGAGGQAGGRAARNQRGNAGAR